MKRYFITGLVILLPLALTVAILAFFVNLLTDPFMGLTHSILVYFNLIETGFLFFSAAQLQYYASKVLILLFLLGLTVVLGALARWYFFHALIRIWDFTLRRIPFVSTIYKTCQDVINTIFIDQANSFKKVVLAPFPTQQGKSIGFVSCEGNVKYNDAEHKLLTVFVPTTPNPTSGFLLLFPESELIFLDMSVEDAFKYIISCGVVKTPINQSVAAIEEKNEDT